METMAGRLLAELEQIISLMDELLDHSTIDHVTDRAIREAEASGVMIVSLTDGLWGPSSDEQKLLQRRLLELWTPWLEQVSYVFSKDTPSRRMEIEEACKPLQGWIERSSHAFLIPKTIDEAKC